MPHHIFSELPPATPDKSGWMWTERNEAISDVMTNGEPWPRITVVTPSYNQGHLIEDTIRSVLLQGYPNLEYIVIDGGSTDQTVDVLRRYDRWITHWVSEPDRGQSHAINKGLALSTGHLLGWLNSDDLLLPGALCNIADLYVEDPAAVAWVGGCYRIDQNRNILSCIIPDRLSRDEIADWWHQGIFYQPSCYFSADAWREVGPLDESLHYALDLDLWLKLSSIGYFVPTVQMLSAALIHNDAKTTSDREKMHAETIAVQVRHGYVSVASDRLSRVIRRQAIRPQLRRKISNWLNWLAFWKHQEKFDEPLSLADQIAKRNE